LSDREGAILLSIFSTYISKGGSLLIQFLSLPLLINYLGNAEFAIVTAIISMFTTLSYLDFGIGVSLQNTLPSLIALKDRNRVQIITSTVFFFLLFLGLFILVLGSIVINLFDFRAVFNLSQNVTLERFNNMSKVLIVIISLGLPLSIIQRLQTAHQRVFINEWFVTIGNLLSIILLLIFINYKLGSPFILLALQGSLLIATFINFSYYFFYKKEYSINIRLFDKKEFFEIFPVGIKYFLILVLSIGLYNIDNFILLRYRSIVDLNEYIIGFRLLYLLNIPVVIYSNSLIPAYNDAKANDEKVWIRIWLNKALKGVFLLCLIESLIFYFAGEYFIKMWLNIKINLTPFKSIGFILTLCFLNYNSLLSSIALTKDYLNSTLIFFPLSIIISIILKFYFATYLHSGYLFLLLVTSITMIFVFLFPLLYKIYKTDYT
jgi:O-antigen/teichoic acid export membrane protein